MECPLPTVNSNSEEIKNYLQKYKNIAIVGASPNPTKDSNKVTKYMIEAGYNVFPIYPKEDEILGRKVYRSLLDIEDKVDIVVVFRKPAAVTAVAEAAIKRGDVDVLWTQLGIVNNEAAKTAQENGIKVVQNLCIKIEHQRYFS
jgi:predicted CoA-binding protein